MLHKTLPNFAAAKMSAILGAIVMGAFTYFGDADILTAIMVGGICALVFGVGGLLLASILLMPLIYVYKRITSIFSLAVFLSVGIITPILLLVLLSILLPSHNESPAPDTISLFRLMYLGAIGIIGGASAWTAWRCLYLQTPNETN